MIVFVSAKGTIVRSYYLPTDPMSIAFLINNLIGRQSKYISFKNVKGKRVIAVKFLRYDLALHWSSASKILASAPGAIEIEPKTALKADDLKITLVCEGEPPSSR